MDKKAENINKNSNEKETLNENNHELNSISSDNDLSSISDKELELNLNFKKDLADKPLILHYIERLQKYIQKQDKKIKKLKSKLKHYKSKHRKSLLIDSCTQTYEEKNEPKSLTEEIKEAAEEAVLKTGFVYESTSGMYYDYNSGYYYNAELGLYYDGNTGQYLVYNSETKSYDFHSQAAVTTNETSKGKRKKPPIEQDKKRHKQMRNDDDKLPLEDGECSSSDGETSDNNSINSDADNSELTDSWPPCMRIMLKETSIPKLKVGALFIVTCDGGTVGREGNHSILIPDINISKHHATISFDKESSKYMIVDLGSRNGTILNGKRMSASKQESEPQEIVHGSVIQIGNTKLLCHIHKGQQTCGHCEPGLVQTEDNTTGEVKSVEKKLTHKEELKRLRKKFGIEYNYGENPQYFPTGYSDRAQHRRKFVGSYTENEKTHQASIDQPVASNNKGFKMLAKMGWKEGKALGKDGTGVKEPIPLVSNVGTTGLGSTEVSVVEDDSSKRKQILWKKTQRRYELSQEVKPEVFKLDDTDDEDDDK